MFSKFAVATVTLAMIAGTVATTAAEARISLNRISLNRIASNRIAFNGVSVNQMVTKRNANGDASTQKRRGEGSFGSVVMVQSLAR
jgi:hypothetical protein